MFPRSSETVSLRDRYTLEHGTIFLTGVQALVRFLIEKHHRDKQTGDHLRRTFIAGYEGSPLGGLDLELRRNLDLLNQDNTFVHQASINEKIAAASVHGSQYNGDVDGFWYGKAHGTKWAADELSLANLSGSGTQSGMVIFSGDDHAAKSSGYPAGSEQILRDVKAAIFYPSSVAEILTYAHHALALSRYSGLVCALKLVTPICDGAATVAVNPHDPQIVLPDHLINGQPYTKTFQPVVIATGSLPYEEEVADIRLNLARAYAQVNGIDRIINAGISNPLGIITTGKSYSDVMQALTTMGLEDRVRVLKLGLIYPVNQEIIRRFAEGLETVVVVEEKGPFVEEPVAHALLGRSVRRIYGKVGPDGNRLIPAHGELNPDLLAALLGPLFLVDFPQSQIKQRMDQIHQINTRDPLSFPRRAAHYCPGCPHSISVRAPAGETAGGEIGCSSIDAYVKADGRGVRYIPTMGMGGALYNGMFPFNGNEHLFQNVGDGTVLHSGLLTIFSSISHGANVTYKILWNHVVAMTGGQDITGQMSLDEFAMLLLGMGVKEVTVVSKYPGQVTLNRARASVGRDQSIRLVGRDKLEEVQQDLARKPGVNVLLFDQECATEARRRRKRQGIKTERYILINEEVCEGCGDCGQKSMCLALYPSDTPFGQKTKILQSACNEDESCLKGDCPSFVAVEPMQGTRLHRASIPDLTDQELPEPEAKATIDDTYAIHIIGIGGTGVVTVAHLLGFAAMFEGKWVNELNRTGLAQKGGPVESPVILGSSDMPLTSHISSGMCDLYLAADIVGGVNPINLQLASPEHTVAVVSRSNIPTAEMVYNPQQSHSDIPAMETTINLYTRSSENIFIDAQTYAVELFGNHMVANVFHLGVAYQAGHIPLQAENIERAIRLNGQAVDLNIQAFRWGRMAILDQDRLDRLITPSHPSSEQIISDHLKNWNKKKPHHENFYRQALDRIPIADEAFRKIWSSRVGELINYQSLQYAERYVRTIERVYEKDQQHGGADYGFRLTQWTAFVLYKLMAYKDEYEVARLLTGESEQKIRDTFDGAVRLSYILHPPLLKMLGLDDKIQLGPWFRPVLRMMAGFKFLRNTRLDPFGKTSARREERELILWYESLIDKTLDMLSPETYPDLVEILRTPEAIRGYEDVKHRHTVRVKSKTKRLLASLDKRITEGSKTPVSPSKR